MRTDATDEDATMQDAGDTKDAGDAKALRPDHG